MVSNPSQSQKKKKRNLNHPADVETVIDSQSLLL